MSTQIGMESIFSQYPNGPMWTGNGPRSVTKDVKFRCPFACPPQVVASISTLDAGNAANTRVSVTCQAITTTGFQIKVETWADTKLAMVAVAWVANL
ncbi:MAG TPA: H-type lectin domain-containing protein [Allosphingosinicella sp.]